jgi:uncharacterized protein (DUF885 family)
MHRPFLHLLPILAASAALLMQACGEESRAPDEPSASPSSEPASAQSASPSDATARLAAAVNDLADRTYEFVLRATPEIAYFSGVEPPRHDGMEDNSPEGRRAREEEIDALLAELEQIPAADLVGRSEWITHAYLLQDLSSEVALRVCQNKLWNVNQMGGWHTGYARIAELQPVGSEELRQQSLARWAKLPGYVNQEIRNLEQGLELGYSAPKPVVQRVVDQVDGLLSLEIEQSPFYSPAVRDPDPEFAAATREQVADGIYPALQRYRHFLQEWYLPRARDALSVTANPDGLACYEASLRSYTTLDRSGREVYELGQATVAANTAAVIALGQAAYGLDDFGAILDRAKNDPADRFADAAELLQFSREAVQRAESVMPRWVGRMPEQRVEVVPFEEHQEGKGMSAHYRPGNADRPAEYRIPLYRPEEQSRGNAEAVAFHETWPGHHLQVAFAQSVEGAHPVTQIIWFSGPGEGWARYSEALAEEMGLYTTTTGPITRRAWPARGMVVDPGIHLFGWTREQAKEYMLESGRFPESMGDEMVDRIAILPGQLTAYDSGGLEILALRREAEATLGDAFDVREFHDRVLENGTIPLPQLRAHLEAWIAEQAETKP